MKPLASIILAVFAAAASARVAAPTTVPAESTPVASPIQRANADAVARLYSQIAAESLGQVPVAQIIERVDGYSILMNGLARAEQIGGPRVVGDDFVQVQLQISGIRAAQLVLQAVAVKPDRSPIPPDRAARLLQDWHQRVFTSTGTSLERARVDVHSREATTAATTPSTARRAELNLDVAPAWVREVLTAGGTAQREQSRLRTARVAEQVARDELRRTIELLTIGDGHKLGEIAMDDDSIRQVIDDATAAASVFASDYRADGSVEMRISLDGQQLWQAILATR